ncbi:MAG: PadR family transcriptional regulator [Candidatus Brockarchaeota archaeon]|nr:PadR family transcriptional regulator [Candidatus Brockarchaeota archaeon]MBO3768775.1 PadR family transcriptional regulator [Candidatus Brockarchaeota archaeon]MBO3802213.1 PadR family transcriptional regulator [Candidatus Brockarchaeota archaeon]
MAFQRLERKLTKENLWIHILSVLKNKPMYGYEIANYLRKDKKIDVAVITVYTVLYKMEREGLVERKSGNVLNMRKVYYSATEKGLNLLKDAITFLEATLASIKG